LKSNVPGGEEWGGITEKPGKSTEKEKKEEAKQLRRRDIEKEKRG